MTKLRSSRHQNFLSNVIRISAQIDILHSSLAQTSGNVFKCVVCRLRLQLRYVLYQKLKLMLIVLELNSVGLGDPFHNSFFF